MKVAVIVGTRPEIIKMAPIIKELEKRRLDFILIHSGQHFSYEMDKVLFKELNLKNSHYNIQVNEVIEKGLIYNGNDFFENPDGCIVHGKQLGIMLGKIEELLFKENPTLVLVQGDTNTTLAGALAAVKLQIKVGHIEAGLRSYDNTMPEEINRILVDRISNYLFCPTKVQKEILNNEGITEEKIFITGNTIVDAINYCLELIDRKESVLKKFDLRENEYFLLTIHRQENVDIKENLKNLTMGINMLARTVGLPILFPIHPRTKNMLKKCNFEISGRINLLNPLSYTDFLELLSKARLILTDSGGVQEESCILRVPCVTLRENTERPETLHVKSNYLAGTDPQRIADCVNIMLKSSRKWENPFGDGTTSIKIVDEIIGLEPLG